MPEIVFIGQIHPQGAKFTLKNFPRIPVTQSPVGTIGVSVQIIDAKITAICDADHLVDDHFIYCYSCSIEVVRLIVDLYAVGNRVGLVAVFEKTRLIGGDFIDFTLHSDAVPILTSYDISKNMAAVSALAFQNAYLRAALHDLGETLLDANMIAINCARAVEAIRHLIAAPNSTPAEAWVSMRELLRVDRSFIQLVTDTSTGPRHGRRDGVDPIINQEIMRRSWIILDRYLHLKLNSNGRLAEEAFPVLFG